MTVRVFEEWRNKPLDEALVACRELVDEHDYAPAGRWRDAGGKVVGHFQVYFPEEIVHAAGALPLKVRGGSIEPTRSDSHFGSYLCSILKTSLELVLSDNLQLDMFVSHPICDAARNLAAIWGRNFEYPCQILYLPQNPNSSHSVQYLTHEYGRLQRSIEDVVGRKVNDEDLKRSIAVFNKNRSLLRELYAIKRNSPWLVTADEAYCLLAVGGMVPREEHNELLQFALPLLRQREVKREDRIRIVFEGGFCEQPPLDLIRMLGRTCYMVDDDLLIGLRWILEDVSVMGKLLENLARAYIEDSSYSPVQHDTCKPKEEMLLARIRGAKADAAVISAAKMCEPGQEEQVAYTHYLDRAKIPYFVTEFEENMSSFESLELQVETFLENLLFA